MTEQTPDQSLTYITQLGSEYYLSDLREQLEKEHMGDYVVIEPVSKRYFVDEDLLLAIQEAEQEFPDSFFTIIKIGSLKPSTAAFKQHSSDYDIFANEVSYSR